MLGELGYGGFGGFVGLGGYDVGGIRGFGGGFGLVCHALHAFFEAAEAFAETFAELGQFASSEEHNQDDSDHNEVPGLKEFHGVSPDGAYSEPCAEPTMIVARSEAPLVYAVNWLFGCKRRADGP
jgi:hypothetical protein